MPREVQDRVNNTGRQQGVPAKLTYANRHGDEIEDSLTEVEDDDSSDASSYAPSNVLDSDDFTYDTDSDTESIDSSHSDGATSSHSTESDDADDSDDSKNDDDDAPPAPPPPLSPPATAISKLGPPPHLPLPLPVDPARPQE